MARRGKPPKRLNATELHAYALHALAARARSAGDLRALLKRRALREEDVDAELARLAEHGYLNDQRYAEAFASWRRENQGLGARRVVRELRSRRVAADVAEQAVREAYAGAEEADMLREYLERRLKNTAMPATPQKIASLYRSLVRAGFSHRLVLDELRRRRADAEILDQLEESDEPEQRPSDSGHENSET